MICITEGIGRLKFKITAGHAAVQLRSPKDHGLLRFRQDRDLIEFRIGGQKHEACSITGIIYGDLPGIGPMPQDKPRTVRLAAEKGAAQNRTKEQKEYP
ncbi:MAG: hypothetical protein IJE58_06250 [Oscillospiraceae bacterium]|nr:hypothetical protein [Oscillospiraceae bacterium]